MGTLPSPLACVPGLVLQVVMQEPHGHQRFNQPATYKSTAYSHEERQALGIKGLLPHRVTTLDCQAERVLENLRRKHFDIERYIFLSALQDRNETLYYRVIIDNIEEMMPLIYTPTVGQACKEFAHIFRRPRGLYITRENRGEIRSLLDNWPSDDVRVIVITDGERILGLGDLGANGMGISIGKLALYSACGGIDPSQCLPVMFDVGTGNKDLLSDPLYLGYPEQRLDGDAYFELMDEFMDAIQDRFPGALVQFEDFLTPKAYTLLDRYRSNYLCFNDDIQGTASVALAGVIASTRVTKVAFKDLRILFLGAGSAATGIGDLMVAALVAQGLSLEEARSRLWFVDQVGLVQSTRQDLMPHNLPYAHEHAPLGFLEAIEEHRPHVLIGATGAPGTFSEQAIRAMSAVNERPAIFALSNPTSRAECTAKQAYEWSEGRALFASGSPFEPVVFQGKTLRPAQGNNAYVFPGIGLGALLAKAAQLPEEVFLAGAEALASCVEPSDLEAGALYPELTRIREVSAHIAAKVAESLIAQGLSGDASLQPEAPGFAEFVASQMYEPKYHKQI